MAEERNVGLARATETTPPTDDEATKAELQRRMEEARESISQTVTEIKDTVTNQYYHVRESISDSLDWREQVRRRPLEFSLGALGVGLLVGYGVGGAFGGGRDAEDDDDYDDDDYETNPESLDVLSSTSRPYASQPVLGGTYGSSAAARGVSSPALPKRVTDEADELPVPASRQSFTSGYEAPASEAVEEDKPSLYSRFRETKAYDRLQSELSSLGDRFVDELSTTARAVVLPALLGKVKDMIGIDLSTQREVAQRSQVEHETINARSKAEAAADNQQTAAGGAKAQ